MKRKILLTLTAVLALSLSVFCLTACKHKHSFTNYVSDNNATLDSDGTKPAVCDNGCGETDTIIDVGSKLTPTDASAFIFNNGVITGLTIYGKTLTKIIIPETINGVKVTSIGEHAFDSCSSLTSVIISDGVKSIGEYAFYSCISLASINISNDVGSIGNWAFGRCTSLTSVEMGFGVTSIGNYAFQGCSSLTSIEIGFSVRSIGNWAFGRCTSLTSVEIPYNTESIGSWTFEYCTSLTNISVDENNEDYKSIDGNLYSKSGKVLFQYAIGKTQTSFTIPEGVTSITTATFYGCSSLTSVSIGNNVTSIGDLVFANCGSLTNVVIPNSVTSIGEYAFSGCNSLTIHCEAESKPSGWSDIWNSSNRPVVWGYKPQN